MTGHSHTANCSSVNHWPLPLLPSRGLNFLFWDFCRLIAWCIAHAHAQYNDTISLANIIQSKLQWGLVDTWFAGCITFLYCQWSAIHWLLVNYCMGDSRVVRICYKWNTVNLYPTMTDFTCILAHGSFSDRVPFIIIPSDGSNMYQGLNNNKYQITFHL